MLSLLLHLCSVHLQPSSLSHTSTPCRLYHSSYIKLKRLTGALSLARDNVGASYRKGPCCLSVRPPATREYLPELSDVDLLFTVKLE